MSIQSIKLENIQSHRNTEIQFHPGVNTIIGTSGSGKSSVFRALIWNRFNRPLKDTLVSWGEKSAKSVVQIDEHSITREKSKTKNTYVIEGPQVEVSLDKVKGSVPEEVENLYKIDQAINIHSQDELWFLLGNTDSPGKVAEQINKVTNLELIDKSKKHIKSKEDRARREKTQIETELNELQTDLEKYEWVEEGERLLKKVKKIKTNLQDTQEKKQSIESYLNLLNEIRKGIEQAQEKIQHKDKIEKALNIRHQMDQTLSKQRQVSRNLKEIQNLRQNLANKDDLVKLGEMVTGALEIKNLKEKNERQGEKIKNAKDKYVQAREKVQKHKERFQKMKDKFHSAFPETCPLCGTIIEKNHNK